MCPGLVDAFHSKNASKEAIKGAKGAKRVWLALLAAGFPFQMLWVRQNHFGGAAPSGFFVSFFSSGMGGGQGPLPP